ncbi:MAG: hypothetical protein EA409_00410 [Saprospirales bacterium]|nr:MAG: hypothetical protein EA409_00410 [Saprospirales bacterium]
MKKLDWIGHVQVWMGSSMSKAEYCRQAGLAYHHFLKWCREVEQGGEENEHTGQFLRIENPGVGDAPKEGFEVILANGVRIVLNGRLDMRILKLLSDV